MIFFFCKRAYFFSKFLERQYSTQKIKINVHVSNKICHARPLLNTTMFLSLFLYYLDIRTE